MVTHFKKKKNIKGRFLLHIVGFLILAIFVVLVVANMKIYRKRQELAMQTENLRNRIEDIKKKNDALRQGILKSDDDQYIEKIAREELALQKPGEKVVSFIVQEAPQQKVDIAQKKIMEIWLGWLGSSWNWVKNKF